MRVAQAGTVNVRTFQATPFSMALLIAVRPAYRAVINAAVHTGKLAIRLHQLGAANILCFFDHAATPNKSSCPSSTLTAVRGPKMAKLLGCRGRFGAAVTKPSRWAQVGPKVRPIAVVALAGLILRLQLAQRII